MTLGRVIFRVSPFSFIISLHHNFIAILNLEGQGATLGKSEKNQNSKWGKVKWNGEMLFRAVKRFIISEISLEMGEMYCV
jgi:hypothetical protein